MTNREKIKVIKDYTKFLMTGEVARVGGIFNGDIPIYMKEQTIIFRKSLKSAEKIYLDSLKVKDKK